MHGDEFVSCGNELGSIDYAVVDSESRISREAELPDTHEMVHINGIYIFLYDRYNCPLDIN
jgi:hypothetical protein